MPSVKTYTWDSAGTKKLLAGIDISKFKYRDFFSMAAGLIHQGAMVTLNRQGARDGKPRWKDFGNGKGVDYYLLKGKTKKGNARYAKRYGTDYVKGEPYNHRYSPSSKLLQRSGGFRQSFRIQRVTDRSMSYGTILKKGNIDISAAIMSNPSRPVLFVTKNDEARIKRLFKSYTVGKMKQP